MDDASQSTGQFSVTEGASDSDKRWARGYKRRVLRAWPPSSDPDYHFTKKTKAERHMAVEGLPHMRVVSDFDDDDNTTTDTSVEDGSFDSPGDARLKAQWQELADLNAKVLEIRSDIKRRKAHVDQTRLQQTFALNAFMSAARLLPAKRTLDYASLKEQFERVQVTRDECGMQEAALESLETDLNNAQDKQDFLLRKLIIVIRSLRRDDLVDPGPIGILEELPPPTEVLLDQVMEPASTCQSLYEDFEIELHALRVALDHRHELFARKTQVMCQQKRFDFLQRNHPEKLYLVEPPQDSDIEFLRSFDHVDKVVSEKTETCRSRAKQVVSRFLNSKFEQPHIPLPLDEVRSLYPYASAIDLDFESNLSVQMETEDNVPSDFPILRSNHMNLFASFPLTANTALKNASSLADNDPRKQVALHFASEEASIEDLVTSAYSKSETDFTNAWLLYQLRTSRHQMYMLYSSVEEGTVIDDLNKWQEGILSNWSTKDEAEIAREQRTKKEPSMSWVGSYTSWLTHEGLSSPPSWFSEAQFVSTEDIIAQMGLLKPGLATLASNGGERYLETTEPSEGSLSSPHSLSEHLLELTHKSPSLTEREVMEMPA